MLGLHGRNWYNSVCGLFFFEVATTRRIVRDHPSDFHISIRRSNTAVCIFARSSAHYLQSRYENKKETTEKGKVLWEHLEITPLPGWPGSSPFFSYSSSVPRSYWASSTI